MQPEGIVPFLLPKTEIDRESQFLLILRRDRQHEKSVKIESTRKFCLHRTPTYSDVSQVANHYDKNHSSQIEMPKIAGKPLLLRLLIFSRFY